MVDLDLGADSGVDGVLACCWCGVDVESVFFGGLGEFFSSYDSSVGRRAVEWEFAGVVPFLDGSGGDVIVFRDLTGCVSFLSEIIGCIDHDDPFSLRMFCEC